MNTNAIEYQADMHLVTMELRDDDGGRLSFIYDSRTDPYLIEIAETTMRSRKQLRYLRLFDADGGHVAAWRDGRTS